MHYEFRDHGVIKYTGHHGLALTAQDQGPVGWGKLRQPGHQSIFSKELGCQHHNLILEVVLVHLDEAAARCQALTLAVVEHSGPFPSILLDSGAESIKQRRFA